MNNFRCTTTISTGVDAATVSATATSQQNVYSRGKSCGKSGGKQNHRTGCVDQWYDLAARVPCDPDGTQMERDRLLEVLSEEFYDERARRGADKNRRPETASNEALVQQGPKNDATKFEPVADEEGATKDEIKSESDDDESDGQTVKSEETSTDASVIIIDSDSDVQSNTEAKLQKLKTLEQETIETLQYIRDSMDALRAKGERSKRRREPLASIGQAAAVSRERSELRVSKESMTDEAGKKAKRHHCKAVHQSLRLLSYCR